MSWLRIDDSFTDHPKVLGLTLQQRWAWLSILCYCARHETEGAVPAGIGEAVRGASPVLLRRCLELGLLEETEAGYLVHDWVIYNGQTVEQRVTYFLDRHPEATGNEVCRQVGGKRELVLDAVRRYHENGSPTGTREPP